MKTVTVTTDQPASHRLLEGNPHLSKDIVESHPRTSHPHEDATA
jgi:hypothetical protein